MITKSGKYFARFPEERVSKLYVFLVRQIALNFYYFIINHFRLVVEDMDIIRREVDQAASLCQKI